MKRQERNKYIYSGTLVLKSWRCEAGLAVSPKIITSLSASKKSAQFINLFLISNILETHDLKDHTNFWPCYPNIIKVTFSFPEFVAACKRISLIHLFIIDDTVNSRVLWPEWPHQFLTMPIQEYFSPYVWYQNFSKQESCRNIANNTNFHYLKATSATKLFFVIT